MQEYQYQDKSIFHISFLLFGLFLSWRVIKFIWLPLRLCFAFCSFLFSKLSGWCCEFASGEWRLSTNTVISEERLGLFNVGAEWTAILVDIKWCPSKMKLGLLSLLGLSSHWLRKFLLGWVDTAVLTSPQSTGLFDLRMS